jgi:hypothetical protein
MKGDDIATALLKDSDVLGRLQRGLAKTAEFGVLKTEIKDGFDQTQKLFDDMDIRMGKLEKSISNIEKALQSASLISLSMEKVDYFEVEKKKILDNAMTVIEQKVAEAKVDLVVSTRGPGTGAFGREAMSGVGHNTAVPP